MNVFTDAELPNWLTNGRQRRVLRKLTGFPYPLKQPVVGPPQVMDQPNS